MLKERYLKDNFLKTIKIQNQSSLQKNFME